jgi:hypothetical protein
MQKCVSFSICRKPELIGGGLIRSVAGWGGLSGLRRMRIYFKSDERVPGDSEFVASYRWQKRQDSWAYPHRLAQILRREKGV